MCIIKFILTSTLAPSPKTKGIYDLVERGGGDRFCCSVIKYNVLDTKGEGVSPSHGGDFLEIWVGLLNTGFVCALLSLN